MRLLSPSRRGSGLAAHWTFVLLLVFALIGCGSREEEVVLYTSQDQFYAEPILKEFTDATGIKVRAVFDTESAKTASLAHRLRAEKSHPQCDVFWSNEEMHARFLQQDGVIEQPQSVGYRTRRIAINTNLLSVANAPKSLVELTNETWRGKVALAYPLFGTTSSHFFALRQHWGEAAWRGWCVALVRNGAKVVDGNSVVVRLVGAGECAIGLTDSDDIAAGKREGLPVAELPLDQESLVIPNTIAIVRRTSRGSLGEKLMRYLAQPETLRRLVDLGALEGVNPQNLGLKTLEINWDSGAANLEQMNIILKQIFLRS
jgi:iron(III) transport system substrate-binding protein